mgnify:CR=1 FL=1
MFSELDACPLRCKLALVEQLLPSSELRHVLGTVLAFCSSQLAPAPAAPAPSTPGSASKKHKKKKKAQEQEQQLRQDVAVDASAVDDVLLLLCKLCKVVDMQTAGLPASLVAPLLSHLVVLLSAAVSTGHAHRVWATATLLARFHHPSSNHTDSARTALQAAYDQLLATHTSSLVRAAVLNALGLVVLPDMLPNLTPTYLRAVLDAPTAVPAIDALHRLITKKKREKRKRKRR